MTSVVHTVPTADAHLTLPFWAKVRRDVKLVWMAFELVVAVYAAWREVKWRAVRAVAWWHWTWPRPTAAGHGSGHQAAAGGRHH